MLQIGIAVVLLGIVVYLHEVGHWGMARLLGVEVVELCLGGLTVLTCLSDLRCFVNWLLLRL